MQLEVLEDRQLLATITVNTTADETAADSTVSLREAIEVSNGTLAVSSLSTQQQAQVSGAVGNTNTIDFNIPKSDPGYNAATGVWTIAADVGVCRRSARTRRSSTATASRGQARTPWRRATTPS